MIEIENLHKSYGKKEVLGGVSLTVRDENILGLVGINGAGKSTLLRLLAGVLRANAGSIRFDGEEIFDNARKKRELFLLPDEPYYAADTTAAKLLSLYSAFYPIDLARYEEYEEKFHLARRAPVRTFSKGMKRQLFVAIALACRPRYLLLDEAFDGLDPLARLEFKRGLIRLQEETGSTVVISSHSLRELEDICSEFALLDGGTVAAAGDIRGTLDSVHKFQVALDREPQREDFPFELLSFEAEGRVARFVARGDRDEILHKVEALSPLFVEEIAVDFEELFLCEVKARGYLQ